MRMLITGVTGFTGRHMAEYALGQGARVLGASLDNTSLPGVEGWKADLTLPGAADEVVAAVRPGLISHLASLVPRDGVEIGADQFITANVIGTLRVLEAVRQSAPEARTLVVTSAAVYGTAGADGRPIKEDTPLDPLTDYAASKAMQDLLRQGDGIYQMMQVTGEEGITIEDYVIWQKATLLDMVFLQQDAFDAVDASMSLERQQESFQLLKGFIDREYQFSDKDEARGFFTRITGAYKNLNYSPEGSQEYERYRQEIVELADKHSVAGETGS